MFYRLADAQDIWVVVHISTSKSVPSSLVATALALTPYLTLTSEASTHVLEVDQLVDVTTILIMEESTLPLTSSKNENSALCES